MINIKKHGIILEPRGTGFESRSVLNPGVIQEGDKVHIIYRAIDEEYISYLGYARLEGPLTVAERSDKPLLAPNNKIESKGIEDPRIVKIEGTYYLTYVAHDGKNAISAYAYGPDLFNLKRGGVISPRITYRDAVKIFSHTKLKDDYLFFESFYQQFGGRNILIWHKDCVLFPEKIDGRFQMLHRILPDIQYVSFESFSELKDKFFWIYYLMNLGANVVLEGEHGFEGRHVGGGAPPIKTDLGWLMIYHSAQEFNKKRIYYAGAALLDLANPLKVIARLPEPLISPTEDWEIKGTVNDVVFPTGTAVFGDELYIYYGAADHFIAVASVNLSELLDKLMKHKR
jgi:beta-1,2-mannobiose phosphorylase / 1,2-beta-oligomannan phosphorylase